MREDLLNHVRILDTGNNLDVPLASLAGFNIDIKNPLQSTSLLDPEKCNGSVVIEWLNVSAGTEASSEWKMAHTELIRSGYPWVGVSAQKSRDQRRWN